jgi:hypothetical protein
MLLRQAPDDSAYWAELSQLAEDAVRFGSGNEEKFAAFCAEHGFDADGYRVIIDNALAIVGSDARSHGLLLHALWSDDSWVVCLAIRGLAAQRDVKSLEAIDHALSRFKNEARFMACELAEFHTDSADRMAMQYIDEADREEYLEGRAPE